MAERGASTQRYIQPWDWGQYFHILATLQVTQCAQQRSGCYEPGLSATAVWLQNFGRCHTLLRLSHQEALAQVAAGSEMGNLREQH